MKSNPFFLAGLLFTGYLHAQPTPRPIPTGYHLRSVSVEAQCDPRAGFTRFELKNVSASYTDRDPKIKIFSSFREANENDIKGKHDSVFVSKEDFGAVDGALLTTTVIVEYILSKDKSIFTVVHVDFTGPTFCMVGFSIPTDQDAIGFRYYQRSNGSLLGGQLFFNEPEPEFHLDALPDGRFTIQTKAKTNGIRFQISPDGGNTWSDQKLYTAYDDRISLPSRESPKGSGPLLIEADIAVGLRIFRKRFTWGGDGKPLPGEYKRPFQIHPFSRPSGAASQAMEESKGSGR